MANGIIIIDKPEDWTSMDVCAKLRGILKTKKVGHAGTLDPMATGVLPVFVGQATRGVSFAESGEKEYVATLQLGLVTDTQDVSGRVLEEHPAAVAAFLADYAASVDWVNSNNADAAQLISEYGIVEAAAVAEKALPHCNIVCITGDEMAAKLSGYLQVLFDAEPTSVGGKLPGDDFYYGQNA